MKTVRAMIGMPVVCRRRRIGRLLQADLSADLRQLDGIWVSGGPGGTRYIPADALELLGEAAILSDSAGARRRPDARPLFRRAVSTDGRRLGAITDAAIDGVSFAVTSLELSAGLWDDLFRGRRQIDRFTVNRITGDVIVDPAGDEMEAQADEDRHDKGIADGHADRRIGGDDLWRDELADGEEVAPAGEEGRFADLRDGRRPRQEAVSTGGGPDARAGSLRRTDDGMSRGRDADAGARESG